MAYEQDRGLAIAAFDSATACQRLSLTAADATLALAGGDYHATLSSAASFAMVRLGAAPTVPASAAAENVGFFVGPGQSFTMRVRPGGDTLHALMVTAAATGVLYFDRVA